MVETRGSLQCASEKGLVYEGIYIRYSDQGVYIKEAGTRGVGGSPATL